MTKVRQRQVGDSGGQGTDGDRELAVKTEGGGIRLFHIHLTSPHHMPSTVPATSNRGEKQQRHTHYVSVDLLFQCGRKKNNKASLESIIISGSGVIKRRHYLLNGPLEGNGQEIPLRDGFATETRMGTSGKSIPDRTES